MIETICIKTPQAIGGIVNWMVGAMVLSVFGAVLAQVVANRAMRWLKKWK